MWGDLLREIPRQGGETFPFIKSTTILLQFNLICLFPVNRLENTDHNNKLHRWDIILVRNFSTFGSSFLLHPYSHLIFHIVQVKSNANMQFSRLWIIKRKNHSVSVYELIYRDSLTINPERYNSQILFHVKEASN